MNCRYYIPMLNLIGRGAVREIGKEAKTLLGRRALVVASRGGVGEAQAGEAAAILQTEGIVATLFCEAVPNPTVDVVTRGVARYREETCDMIVAIGGGSAIDSAKVIGIVANNGGSVRDYEGVNRSTRPMPPFIAVATTAGTGSEVTQYAVISDEADHSKFVIEDWHMTPNVSVNDPELMLSMPPQLTAATGMDALSHAVEAYVSKNASPVTDAKAYKAVELIAASLRKAVADGDDIDAREDMCYASFLAGTAFNNAGLGLLHAMSHPVGGTYNLPHGLINAMLLPAVVKFNMDLSLDKYASLAVAMGVGKPWHSELENCDSLLRALRMLCRDLDLPDGLSALGVRQSDFPALASEAMAEAIGRTNPRVYTEEQVLEVYRAAF